MEKTGNSEEGQKSEALTVLVEMVINKEWAMTPELNSIKFSRTKLTI